MRLTYPSPDPTAHLGWDFPSFRTYLRWPYPGVSSLTDEGQKSLCGISFVPPNPWIGSISSCCSGRSSISSPRTSASWKLQLCSAFTFPWSSHSHICLVFADEYVNEKLCKNTSIHLLPLVLYFTQCSCVLERWRPISVLHTSLRKWQFSLREKCSLLLNPMLDLGGTLTILLWSDN